MDNFKIDIKADSDASLRKAIDIAFAHNAVCQTVQSYQVVTLESSPTNRVPEELNGKTALVLCWDKVDRQKEDARTNLPCGLDSGAAADVAMRWLAEQKWGPEPDHDGDNRKGWRILTGVSSVSSAVCTIVPAWAIYRK